MSGLLLFVIETVTFVVGDPMLDMLALIPELWDTTHAKPAPNASEKTELQIECNLQYIDMV